MAAADGSPAVAREHPAEVLARARPRFLKFVQGQVRDPARAEDLVQRALLKAIERGDTIDDDAVAWFYRVLRNAIVDEYRRDDARSRAVAQLEPPVFDEPAARRVAAQCARTLVHGLPPEQMEVVRAVDLDEEPIAAVAARLGISKNLVSQRAVRGRRKLKELLLLCCGIAGPDDECGCAADADQ